MYDSEFPENPEGRIIPVHSGLSVPTLLAVFPLSFVIVVVIRFLFLPYTLLEHRTNMYGYHAVGSLPLYRDIFFIDDA